jgi:outer membrane receptor protein involved in Fe transport
VLATQLYYEIGGLSAQAIYNDRSHYYQDFVGGNSQLRYVSPVGTLDFNVSYDINRNIRLEFQALNVLNEGRIDYMPVYGSVRQSYFYGSKYFIGARFRF